LQEQIKRCPNCNKIIVITRNEKKDQKYCNTLCSSLYKVTVDKKTNHLTGLARKRRRWALYNKDRVKESQQKHYKLNKRKRLLNVRNWQKKNPDKVKNRVLKWQKSEKGKAKHNISSLKNYHKKKNIIKFLDMLNEPTNSFINVTL